MERARRAGRWMAVLIVVGLSVAACADKAAEEEGDSGAATVEAVKGSDLSQVTLTEEAAKRIDVQLGAVGANAGGEGTQIPYSSVLYDPQGDTWAFVNVKGLTFVRAPITIDHIDGDVAFLAEGPPTGTKIVKVGATQLYGAEIGVGEDE
jgi:hypothetical protein